MLRPLSVNDDNDLCMRAALIFAFLTGSRVSNYASVGVGRDHPLRWRDVAFDLTASIPAVCVTRRTSKTRQGGKYKPHPLWLGAAPRTPTLCPVAALRAWHSVCVARGRARSRDHVFVRSDGTRLSAAHVNDFLATRAVAAGVTALTSHCMRVSFMTCGSICGATRAVLYRQADFANPTTNVTAEYTYVHDFRVRMVRLTQQLLLTTSTQLATGTPAATDRRARR